MNGVRTLELSPSYLTVVDIDPPLRHVAHASLWVAALEAVQVVHVRRLVRQLEIPDYTVTLET